MSNAILGNCYSSGRIFALSTGLRVNRKSSLRCTKNQGRQSCSAQTLKWVGAWMESDGGSAQASAKTRHSIGGPAPDGQDKNQQSLATARLVFYLCSQRRIGERPCPILSNLPLALAVIARSRCLCRSSGRSGELRNRPVHWGAGLLFAFSSNSQAGARLSMHEGRHCSRARRARPARSLTSKTAPTCPAPQCSRPRA